MGLCLYIHVGSYSWDHINGTRIGDEGWCPNPNWDCTFDSLDSWTPGLMFQVYGRFFLHDKNVRTSRVNYLLCISTSFWVLLAPKICSKHFFGPFSTFFVHFKHFSVIFQLKSRNMCLFSGQYNNKGYGTITDDI